MEILKHDFKRFYEEKKSHQSIIIYILLFLLLCRIKSSEENIRFLDGEYYNQI